MDVPWESGIRWTTTVFGPENAMYRSREYTVSVPKRLKMDHNLKRTRRCVHTLHCIEPSYKKHKIAPRATQTRRDETKRDESFGSVRRADLRGVGGRKPPTRVLVHHLSGPLAHERRWHARLTPRRDAFVDEDVASLPLEGAPLDALGEHVFALAMLAVGALVRS